MFRCAYRKSASQPKIRVYYAILSLFAAYYQKRFPYHIEGGLLCCARAVLLICIFLQSKATTPSMEATLGMLFCSVDCMLAMALSAVSFQLLAPNYGVC
jgi:hypothetical protein